MSQPIVLKQQPNMMEKNLKALQRVDPTIVEIVKMAYHVVVYKFSLSAKAWEREDIEGCMYVVRRSMEPRFNIVVLNRQNATNLIQVIDPSFEYEVIDPYLIFKNAYGIRGIWFADNREREEMIQSLQMIATSVPVKQHHSVPQLQQQQMPPSPLLQPKSPLLQPNSPLLQPQSFMQPPAQLHHRNVHPRSQTPNQRPSPALLNPSMFVNPDTPQTQSTPSNPDEVLLGKSEMQDVLLKLIKNDQFIDILHKEYLQSMQKRSKQHSHQA